MVKEKRNLRGWIGRAVVVKWHDPDFDWTCFRLEHVEGDWICMTGMTDENGNPHAGDWIRVRRSDIKSMELRN